MKAHNLKMKSLVLITALSVSGVSYANSGYEKADGKKVVRVSVKEPLVRLMSNSFDIDLNNLEYIKDQINEANIFLVSNNIENFEISFDPSSMEKAFYIVEYSEDTPALEDWMFEEEYYTYEAEPVIEDWMLEEDYLNTESVPVLEDWMFEEDYYVKEARPVFEAWMMEEDYLSTETAPVMEDWMLDEDYYSSEESVPEFEEWMFNENYLSTEPVPVIEAWMTDAGYFN